MAILHKKNKKCKTHAKPMNSPNSLNFLSNALPLVGKA